MIDGMECNDKLHEYDNDIHNLGGANLVDGSVAGVLFGVCDDVEYL